jgi:hypothetical protein
LVILQAALFRLAQHLILSTFLTGSPYIAAVGEVILSRQNKENYLKLCLHLMAVQDSPACVANLILSLFSKIEKHYLAGDSTEIQGD